MGLPVQQTNWIQMFQQECDNCKRPFGFTESHRQRMEESGGDVFCPYCKSPHSYTESELDAEKRRHRETLARLNEVGEKKANLERKLRRVNRGVCPECNRTFQNLARHMACKHK